MLEGIFNTTLVFLVLGCLIVLLLSFAAMVIFEWISDVFKWRSKFLKEAISEMLDDSHLTELVYNHPLIANLYQFGKKSSLPNYIPTKKFSMALFEIISKEAPTSRETVFESAVSSFQIGVQNLNSFRLKETLEALLRNAQFKSESGAPSADAIHVQIQEWFDDEMNALARYYRQRTRFAYYVIGITLAFSLNIDSGKILSSLWYQATFPQRQSMLEQTISYFKDNSSSSQELEETISAELQSNLSVLDFPIGWQFSPFETFGKQCALIPTNASQVWGLPSWNSQGLPICKRLANMPPDLFGWIGKLVGMFGTGAFIPVGGGILFDVMKKLTNIRTVTAQ
jgi:hypothetical protein